MATDVPPAPRHVPDIEVDYKDPEALKAGLENVAKAMQPHEPWTSSPITVTVISGGITNLLYRVNCGSEALLIRVFGAKTELLIDREKDNAVFHALSDRRFGPRFYGTFGNGRVEGWIPAKPLEPPDMGLREPRDLVALISAELARMHTLVLPYEPKPMLWDFLTLWLGMAEEVRFDDDSTKADKLRALDLPWIASEMRWLQTQLPSPENDAGKALIDAATAAEDASMATALTVASEVVFSHNDLLSGNILDVEGEARVQFIDFEYGGYNFAAFDLANHFCEYAGFDFDLDKWYPKKDAQLHFIRVYLQGRLAGAGAELSPALEALKAAISSDAADAFYDSFYTVVNKFALASHFFWGLWAIIQGRHSPIDFDFMQYAVERFGGYRKHKAQFFPDA